MSLIQVATTSVSNVSTFSITGIDDNSIYKLVLHELYMNSDGARPRMRFTKSSDSSADTTSNYDGKTMDMYVNQSFSDNNFTNSDYYNGFGIGTTNLESLMGVYYIYNFNDSSEYSFITIEEFTCNNAGEYAGRIGGMCLTVNQATNGFM
jgi:hypothetical protein